jgi:hypothetical protein
MKRVAAVLTLAIAVTLAALGYAQHNGAPPDVSPRATGSDMTNGTLPSGWANPNTGGAGQSVNNGVNAEPPAAAVPAAPIDSGTTLSQSSGDDNSKATSGNDANGAGWGNSDSNATSGGDNGGSDSAATGGGDTGDSDSSAASRSDTGDSDSSATSGSDTGDSDNSAIGAEDSAGASEVSNDSGDSDSNASGDSDSDTTSGGSGDTSADSGGSDTSSSDSADSSGWK